MGIREDELKVRIEDRYGSIPKFCEAAGIAPSTIYNILSRGIENTRTRTMQIVYSYIKLDDEPKDDGLSEDEMELVAMFRKMNEKQRAAVMETARAMVG